MGRNPFNLWAPTLEPGVIDDVIKYIVNEIRNGAGENFTIDLDDDFSDYDIEYIRTEVMRRLG